MRVPAALEQWAAEHTDQLSDQTVDEVHTIASTIAESALGERSIHGLAKGDTAEYAALFSGARSERAAAVIDIVAEWAARQPRAELDENEHRKTENSEPDAEPGEETATDLTASPSDRSALPLGAPPAERRPRRWPGSCARTTF